MCANAWPLGLWHGGGGVKSTIKTAAATLRAHRDPSHEALTVCANAWPLGLRHGVGGFKNTM